MRWYQTVAIVPLLVTACAGTKPQENNVHDIISKPPYLHVLDDALAKDRRTIFEVLAASEPNPKKRNEYEVKALEYHIEAVQDSTNAAQTVQ